MHGGVFVDFLGFASTSIYLSAFYQRSLSSSCCLLGTLSFTREKSG